MVKPPKTNLKRITQNLKISAQRQSVLALGHEVCEIRCFTSKPKFGACHWWLCLESQTKTYRFWVHACVGYAWHFFSHLFTVFYEHQAKEDTKCHQLQSAVMGSCGFCALKFYINSKSLTLNLKNYMLSLIPNSASSTIWFLTYNVI